MLRFILLFLLYVWIIGKASMIVIKSYPVTMIDALHNYGYLTRV